MFITHWDFFSFGVTPQQMTKMGALCSSPVFTPVDDLLEKVYGTKDLFILLAIQGTCFWFGSKTWNIDIFDNKNWSGYHGVLP